MYITVRSALAYQKGALELLHIYLQSEYRYLQYGDFDKIELLESRIIHIVQNAFENSAELDRLLGGRSIREFAAGYEEYMGQPLLDLLRDIETFQGQCRAQAALNKALARVLDEEHMERIGALYGIPSADNSRERVRYH